MRACISVRSLVVAALALLRVAAAVPARAGLRIDGLAAALAGREVLRAP